MPILSPETMNWLIAREVCRKLCVDNWKSVVTSIEVTLDSDPDEYNTIEKKMDAAFLIALPHSNLSRVKRGTKLTSSSESESSDDDEDRCSSNIPDEFEQPFWNCVCKYPELMIRFS